MDVKELISRYEAGERNFISIKLEDNSEKVNLNGLDLRNINLSRSELSDVNFCDSNLIGADFSNAELINSNFNNACLVDVNFKEASLDGASFEGANLTNANLIGSYLYLTKFMNANLMNTILDANNKVPESDLSELNEDGDFVIGYRTKKSIHLSEMVYLVGNCYNAPYFSVDIVSVCHPGIYLAPLDWLKKVYAKMKYVKVKAFKNEVLKVEDKYRAKRIWVLEDLR